MTKDLTEGLKHCLDINTLQDYSGNSWSATNSGTTNTTDQYGRYNQARDFDGSSGIALPTTYGILDGSEDFSIEINIKFDAFSSDRKIVELEGENSVILFYLHSATAFYAMVYISGWKICEIPVASLNTTDWFHFTYTYNTTDGTSLYLNGILQDTDSTTGTIRSGVGTGSRLGKQYDDANYFDGQMSTYKLWNRTLSAEEVNQLYSETKHNYQGLLDGLVAGYDFKGDAKDFSGNGYDGTVSGATLTTNQFEMTNSAYSFDGTNDEIDTNSLLGFSSGDDISMSCWVKFDDIEQYGFIISQLNAITNYGLSVFAYVEESIRVTTMASGASAGTQTVFSSANTGINTTDWFHLVAQVPGDGSQTKLYVNGELMGGTADNWGTMTQSEFSGEDFFIGAEAVKGAKRYFDGKISDVKIFNKLLTAGETKALYNITKSGFAYPYPQHRTGGIHE